MNKSELNAEMKKIEDKILDMRTDLAKIGELLSPSSSLAIIIRMVNLTKELEDYQAMLDIIVFDEITKGMDLD
jgi:hypothetical protein